MATGNIRGVTFLGVPRLQADPTEVGDTATWNGMRTAWNGPAAPEGISSTTGSTLLGSLAGLKPSTLPLILGDMAGTITTVALSTQTRAVQLWPVGSSIWYAVDEAPGPIPAPTTILNIPGAAFVNGRLCMADQWTTFTMPADALSHTLQLMSQDPSVYVVVVRLEDVGG